jgi:hypothetical protein
MPFWLWPKFAACMVQKLKVQVRILIGCLLPNHWYQYTQKTRTIVDERRLVRGTSYYPRTLTRKLECIHTTQLQVKRHLCPTLCFSVYRGIFLDSQEHSTVSATGLEPLLLLNLDRGTTGAVELRRMELQTLPLSFSAGSSKIKIRTSSRHKAKLSLWRDEVRGVTKYEF